MQRRALPRSRRKHPSSSPPLLTLTPSPLYNNQIHEIHHKVRPESIELLRRDYAATLAKVASLTAHGEITFDTLFALFVPRTIVLADCPVTGEPRAFELVSATRFKNGIIPA